MRTIKFRVWDKENKKMIKEGAFLAPNGWRIVSNEAWAYEMDEPFEWLQFTGLTDSKGVEVYEGDICKVTSDFANKDLLVEVYWHTKLARFELNNKTGNAPSFSKLLSPDYKIVVIGNIYDSPISRFSETVAE